MDIGPAPPAGMEAVVFGAACARLCGRTAAVGAAAAVLSGTAPVWSFRMVTVCIFFGSDETGGTGAAAAAGIVGGGAGQTESPWLAAASPLMPGATAPWLPGAIGTVETTRDEDLGASTATGCSSRDSRLSVEPVVATPCPALLPAPACGSSAILFGPPLALMIGGRGGRTLPPNIAPQPKAPAVPTIIKAKTAMIATSPVRRRGLR